MEFRSERLDLTAKLGGAELRRFRQYSLSGFLARPYCWNPMNLEVSHCPHNCVLNQFGYVKVCKTYPPTTDNHTFRNEFKYAESFYHGTYIVYIWS